MAPSFTRSFDRIGARLVSLARPGCQPILFAPSQRKHTLHACAGMLAPFERIVARPDQLSFVIFASLWPYAVDPKELSELIGQFDPARTRVLLMGPGPVFYHSGLDCVVLSDRYGQNRNRCVRARAELETARAAMIETLKSAAAGRDNVRYIDPKRAFCDQRTCRPFDGDQVFFQDAGHVLPPGAERIFKTFAGDFAWLAKGQ
jgi:hypothetical protein